MDEIIVALGISLGFFVQTILGFAAALVAIPILLQVKDLPDAIGLMSIFYFVFSLILVYKNRKEIDKNTVMPMLFSGVIGLILGISTLKTIHPLLLKKSLGIFIILYVVYLFFKDEKIKISKNWGGILGFIGGFLSGLYGFGGPLFIIYIHSRIKKASIIRATVIGTLGVINFLRVPILIYNDILNLNVLKQSLFVFPFFLLALFLGHQLYHKINEKTFNKMLIGFLLLSAISLIIK